VDEATLFPMVSTSQRSRNGHYRKVELFVLSCSEVPDASLSGTQWHRRCVWSPYHTEYLRSLSKEHRLLHKTSRGCFGRRQISKRL